MQYTSGGNAAPVPGAPSGAGAAMVGQLATRGIRRAGSGLDAGKLEAGVNAVKPAVGEVTLQVGDAAGPGARKARTGQNPIDGPRVPGEIAHAAA